MGAEIPEVGLGDRGDGGSRGQSASNRRGGVRGQGGGRLLCIGLELGQRGLEAGVVFIAAGPHGRDDLLQLLKGLLLMGERLLELRLGLARLREAGVEGLELFRQRPELLLNRAELLVEIFLVLFLESRPGQAGKYD